MESKTIDLGYGERTQMGKVRHNLKTSRKTHIRAWRKHRGLTLERLADRVDRASFDKWIVRY